MQMCDAMICPVMPGKKASACFCGFTVGGSSLRNSADSQRASNWTAVRRICGTIGTLGSCGAASGDVANGTCGVVRGTSFGHHLHRTYAHSPIATLTSCMHTIVGSPAPERGSALHTWLTQKRRYTHAVLSV